MAHAFHLMLKPAGALCNLTCDYCFFRHKTESLNSNAVMSDRVLETLVRDYIASQQDKVIVFSWQGGEPALAGLDFFRKAVALQKKYCPPGKFIENDFQTNGTCLDEEWFRFLRENRFLVGISLDGPPALHDLHRRTHDGAPTCDTVLACIERLKAHRIPFNVLTAVNRDNAGHPLTVYRFLRDVAGAEHIQFLPVVEPRSFEADAPGYWDLGSLCSSTQCSAFVTPWSVLPEQYGDFLTAVFYEWYEHDRSKRFIYLFEALLGVWLGLPATQCTLAESCGNALALDADGALYSCDRFCYPEYRIGRITQGKLLRLTETPAQKQFRQLKRQLPDECRTCEFHFACHGGCPKNRFLLTASGAPGRNYLCAGIRAFLSRISPEMDQMAAEFRRAEPSLFSLEAPGRGTTR